MHRRAWSEGQIVDGVDRRREWDDVIVANNRPRGHVGEQPADCCGYSADEQALYEEMKANLIARRRKLISTAMSRVFSTPIMVKSDEDVECGTQTMSPNDDEGDVCSSCRARK